MPLNLMFAMLFGKEAIYTLKCILQALFRRLGAFRWKAQGSVQGAPGQPALSLSLSVYSLSEESIYPPLKCACVCAFLLLSTACCSTTSKMVGPSLLLLSLMASLASAKETFPLFMPKVLPTQPEEYLCTPVRLDEDKEFYITGFDPQVRERRSQDALQMAFCLQESG